MYVLFEEVEYGLDCVIGFVSAHENKNDAIKAKQDCEFNDQENDPLGISLPEYFISEIFDGCGLGDLKKEK
jgi:hypothetical protein